MNSIVKHWYETKVNVDEMNHWTNPKLKKWEQGIAEGYFPANCKILDIGCGLGREAYVLSDMGFEVVGLDISQEVVLQAMELSKSKGYSIPFLHYDGHALPFGDSSFDVVVIWAQTFGLLYGNDYKTELLLESKRVLKDGGLLSFSAHDYKYLEKHYPRCLKDRRFYPYANADIYWEALEPNQLIDPAEGVGFRVILCETGEIYKPEDGTVLHCLCQKYV